MKSIADIMAEKLKVEEKPKRGGINSPRSEVAGQLLVFMGEDKTLDEEKKLEAMTPGAGKAAKKKRLNQRIKYWLGRTKKLEPKAIYGLMSQAKEGKNRAALFNYLLKNYGKKSI
jgi:hypothetical protein